MFKKRYHILIGQVHIDANFANKQLPLFLPCNLFCILTMIPTQATHFVDFSLSIVIDRINILQINGKLIFQFTTHFQKLFISYLDVHSQI